MLQVIKYSEWNDKVKDRNEVSSACENDITMKIDELYCCCETKNGCNNIMVFSEKTDIRNIKRAYMFVILLYYIYNIRYITISGTLRRYGFIEKLFADTVVRDPTITDKRVLYIKLDNEVMEKLRREIVK